MSISRTSEPARPFAIRTSVRYTVAGEPTEDRRVPARDRFRWAEARQPASDGACAAARRVSGWASAGLPRPSRPRSRDRARSESPSSAGAARGASTRRHDCWIRRCPRRPQRAHRGPEPAPRASTSRASSPRTSRPTHGVSLRTGRAPDALVRRSCSRWAATGAAPGRTARTRRAGRPSNALPTPVGCIGRRPPTRDTIGTAPRSKILSTYRTSIPARTAMCTFSPAVSRSSCSHGCAVSRSEPGASCATSQRRNPTR